MVLIQVWRRVRDVQDGSAARIPPSRRAARSCGGPDGQKSYSGPACGSSSKSARPAGDAPVQTSRRKYGVLCAGGMACAGHARRQQVCPPARQVRPLNRDLAGGLVMRSRTPPQQSAAWVRPGSGPAAGWYLRHLSRGSSRHGTRTAQGTRPGGIYLRIVRST